ncbi:MAG: preprotein translocase subunit YajC [Candidatus Nanopelagicales bacterium]
MNATPLLMLVVLGLAFWLMVLRPAKARQRAALNIQNQLVIGQRVMTTAGMFGYVRELDETEIGLEISDGVVVRYVREAIAKVVDTEASATDATPATDAVADVSDGEESVVDVSRNQ